MNMNVFKVDISTPQKSWTFENVVSCSAPGKKGNFQVLFNHAPLISQLETGEIKIQIAEKTTYFATGGGFLEVNNNNVTLVLESCEEASEIDVERARKAAERARKRLSSRSEGIDIARAEAALARALNRLRVAMKIGLSSE